jgi:2-polyprenyl-3-methyl-5-hydroxy-6-metoxy-1,4-benzoquinol methylase
MDEAREEGGPSRPDGPVGDGGSGAGAGVGVGVDATSRRSIATEPSISAAERAEQSEDSWRDRNGSCPVSYHHVREAKRMFRRAIARQLEAGSMRFCDVGGANRPVLALPTIRQYGLDYVILDESERQLDRTPAGYRLVHASVLDRSAVAELAREHGGFDVVISRWTAEHIPDGRLFHTQIFSMLRPGGTAIHLFPTLYALPFVVNRLLSADVSAALLLRVAPKRRNKFPAHYRWCRGPSRGQLERLRSVGFAVEHYAGFFGHSLYARLTPLDRAHQLFTRVLVGHPRASMTSFAVVVLSRPA